MAALEEKVNPTRDQATHYDIATHELDNEDIRAASEDVPEKGGAKVSEIYDGERRAKLLDYYGYKAEEDTIAPRADITAILDRVTNMDPDEAVQILVQALDFHKSDPNFPAATFEKCQHLLRGYKAADTAETEWQLELCTEAAIIKYHSPYPEVRAVTDPFDDTTTPCETLRSYFLGLCFMAGVTAINTFFAPRQPAISIKTTVIQLILAPCGIFCARFLPDWGFTVGKTRWTLNPGPWTLKEQALATLMFNVAHGPGAVYNAFLVQRLPQYFAQEWVTFGYEICMAFSTQFFGFGLAGLMRRFVIFPVNAIWPGVLPALALNRAIIVPEAKGDVINGWKISRYRFFLTSAACMFCWFWVPNTLFTALRSFNWMTWIAPSNFKLAVITGFWGGMGYNPWATFDWNVSGTTYLVTPFFSNMLQFVAALLTGLIIIGMNWSNLAWTGYLPINSNESFTNNGSIYNVRSVLGDNGRIDPEKYKKYGPPYWSSANLVGAGAWYVWYGLSITYIPIRYWTLISQGAKGMWRGFRHRSSMFEDHDDAHSRMISKYPEVPDWWFGAVLVGSFVIGVVALENWPTDTPWYALLGVVGLSALFLLPANILTAVANIQMAFNNLFQMLAGAWFVGNPQAQIIVVAFGQNFDVQAETFVQDQKFAHYAKVPPRASFRAQMLAVFLQCFIFVGMIDWMITSYDDGTLCTWSNSEHFVCTSAVVIYSSSIMYGAFGVRNFFRLYPVLPYLFLLGAGLGILWALLQIYAARIATRWASEREQGTLQHWKGKFFGFFYYLNLCDPSVFWDGAMRWTGGNNLSYRINGMYLSFIFMYYIKRRFGAWWEKYNYLLEAGFDVGVAISAIIQTLALQFGAKKIALHWWGNTVSQAGVDFQIYNQKGSLYPLPAQGYFGLDPSQYPTDFGQK